MVGGLRQNHEPPNHQPSNRRPSSALRRAAIHHAQSSTPGSARPRSRTSAGRRPAAASSRSRKPRLVYAAASAGARFSAVANAFRASSRRPRLASTAPWRFHALASGRSPAHVSGGERHGFRGSSLHEQTDRAVVRRERRRRLDGIEEGQQPFEAVAVGRLHVQLGKAFERGNALDGRRCRERRLQPPIAPRRARRSWQTVSTGRVADRSRADGPMRCATGGPSRTRLRRPARRSRPGHRAPPAGEAPVPVPARNRRPQP